MRSKNLIPTLRRQSKDVGAGVRSSKQLNEGCKRHPKHRQSPGVCSLCLVDKLSKLSAHSSLRRRRFNTTINTVTAASNCLSSSSLSSYYSSSSSSSSSSPVRGYRFITEGKGSSFSFLWFNGKKNVLTKSRSVAFASRMRSKEYHDDKKKKKSGFLSKFLVV